MEKTNSPFTNLFFISISLVLLLTDSRFAHACSSPVSDDLIDFIKDSCNVTTYPKLCFRSLKPYAAKINKSPLKLSKAAIEVSYARGKQTYHFMKELAVINKKNMTKGTFIAMQDCFELMRGFNDAVRFSRKQAALIKPGGGNDTQIHIREIQNQLSAAMSGEDTCVDSMEEAAADGYLKSALEKRMSKLQKYVTNGLSLIVNYASSSVNITTGGEDHNP